MVELNTARPRLAEQIDGLIARIGLRRKLNALLSDEAGVSPRTFGTFTRHYLVIPVARAADLEIDLDSTDTQRQQAAEAIILHELSHFANRDVVPVLFARSLLIMTVLYASASMVVTMLTPFLYNTLIRFYDFSGLFSGEMATLLQAAKPEMAEFIQHPPSIGFNQWFRYELFVFSAHWPLVLGGLFLLVFFWRTVLRTRELYADARVAQWQGTTNVIQIALMREAARAALHGAAQLTTNNLRRWLTVVRQWLVVRYSEVIHALRLSTLLANHPTSRTRQECLERPNLIYGTPGTIGATAGVTVAMLNLALGSVFLSRFLRGPNATLPFVLGFVVLSLSYLPTLCAAAQTNLRRSFTRSTLIFTVIKLIPQYLAGLMLAVTVITDPSVIDQAAFTMVGGGGENVQPLGISPEFIIEIYVIRPAILFTFIMPLTLIGWLQIDARLKRAVLTWYGSPFLQKRPVVLLWGITAWLAGVLWFIVLPFYNVATAPTAYSLLDPWALIPLLITACLSVVAGIWLMGQHRRYARYCPTCQTRIPGEFQLGDCCQNCGGSLHAWLGS